MYGNQYFGEPTASIFRVQEVIQAGKHQRSDGYKGGAGLQWSKERPVDLKRAVT
jgi:hypothetical protein